MCNYSPAKRQNKTWNRQNVWGLWKQVQTTVTNSQGRDCLREKLQRDTLRILNLDLRTIRKDDLQDMRRQHDACNNPF